MYRLKKLVFQLSDGAKITSGWLIASSVSSFKPSAWFLFYILVYVQIVSLRIQPTSFDVEKILNLHLALLEEATSHNKTNTDSVMGKSLKPT